MRTIREAVILMFLLAPNGVLAAKSDEAVFLSGEPLQELRAVSRLCAAQDSSAPQVFLKEKTALENQARTILIYLFAEDEALFRDLKIEVFFEKRITDIYVDVLGDKGTYRLNIYFEVPSWVSGAEYVAILAHEGAHIKLKHLPPLVSPARGDAKMFPQLAGDSPPEFIEDFELAEKQEAAADKFAAEILESRGYSGCALARALYEMIKRHDYLVGGDYLHAEIDRKRLLILMDKCFL